jgi:hypothetical protein
MAIVPLGEPRWKRLAVVAWCLPSDAGEMHRLKGPRLRYHHVALLGQFQSGGEGAGPG